MSTDIQVIPDAAQANEQRKTQRASVAATQHELDALAAEMYAQQGISWAEVAANLGYANGAVARRAALRHLGRTQHTD